MFHNVTINVRVGIKQVFYETKPLSKIFFEHILSLQSISDINTTQNLNI